jgi:hypothetical protein
MLLQIAIRAFDMVSRRRYLRSLSALADCYGACLLARSATLFHHSHFHQECLLTDTLVGIMSQQTSGGSQIQLLCLTRDFQANEAPLVSYLEPFSLFATHSNAT